MSKTFASSAYMALGNPHHVADILADALLDKYLELDPDAHVDLSVMIAPNLVIVSGHVNSFAEFSIDQTIRSVLKDIGYNSSELGLDAYKVGIEIFLTRQSQDISRAIVASKMRGQGSGDQAIVVGMATNETPSFLPLPFVLARQVAARLNDIRKMGLISDIRPDGKVQITIEYENDTPKRIDSLVMAVQHSPHVDTEWLQMEISEKVIHKVCKNWIDEQTTILINTTGRFVIGGPKADIGMSGSKASLDCYGGLSRWYGCTLSGKDPSKIDRTGSLIARKAAKTVIARGLADKCEVQIVYAIGIAAPLAIEIDTFGSARVDDADILDMIKKDFSFKPFDIVNQLDLKRGLYKDLAENGYFGRDDLDWEIVE